jgi:MoaD family protein
VINISIPTPLRNCTGGRATVDVPGTTVSDVLSQLTQDFPPLKSHLFEDSGSLRRFVNVFVNGEDIRLLSGMDSPVSDGDRLQIVPAIAGGNDQPRDFSSWRTALKAQVAETEPQFLSSPAAAGVTIVDVRSHEEWKEGHIPGAIHLDRGFLEMQIEHAQPDRSAKILCYCESGTRSLFAANTLEQMGYEDVTSLAGGILRWKSEGGSIVKPAVLSQAAAMRYKRQLSIPEVKVEGQRKLNESRVLMVGMGGLGCPVSLYLAAAGVGQMGLVDDDVVDLSNLHRQILYGDSMIGDRKVESARKVLSERNPGLRTVLYPERLTLERALELFADYDVIVDGTDNFASRYLINDAAAQLGKPVVHGAVYRFTGQVGVFWAGKGPCYRCLFPQQPPPELAPSCAEGGVLGVLPGTVGLLMATETIKVLLGIGELPLGKLLNYDALGTSFLSLTFGVDPECEACGGGRAAQKDAGLPAVSLVASR